MTGDALPIIYTAVVTVAAAACLAGWWLARRIAARVVAATERANREAAATRAAETARRTQVLDAWQDAMRRRDFDTGRLAADVLRQEGL